MTQAEAPKVLLLGGTSETAPLALKIARAGYQVLVSTATDEPLRIGEHPAITRRCGRLGLMEMSALLVEKRFSVLVDASHPYASEVHQTARRACAKTGCNYFRYQRQETQTKNDDWVFAENHAQAAVLACKPGRSILLTTGSRHLRPYVQEARQRNVPLYARVLEHEESILACDEAGLAVGRRIYGRGPFSCEDNVALIRRLQIGVVVSKESGQVGGVEEKWQAAHQEGCVFVVVKRPDELHGRYFTCMDDLVQEL